MQGSIVRCDDPTAAVERLDEKIAVGRGGAVRVAALPEEERVRRLRKANLHARRSQVLSCDHDARQIEVAQRFLQIVAVRRDGSRAFVLPAVELAVDAASSREVVSPSQRVNAVVDEDAGPRDRLQVVLTPRLLVVGDGVESNIASRPFAAPGDVGREREDRELGVPRAAKFLFGLPDFLFR